jgi:hypothetical protein
MQSHHSQIGSTLLLLALVGNRCALQPSGSAELALVAKSGQARFGLNASPSESATSCANTTRGVLSRSLNVDLVTGTYEIVRLDHQMKPNARVNYRP